VEGRVLAVLGTGFERRTKLGYARVETKALVNQGTLILPNF